MKEVTGQVFFHKESTTTSIHGTKGRVHLVVGADQVSGLAVNLVRLVDSSDGPYIERRLLSRLPEGRFPLQGVRAGMLNLRSRNSSRCRIKPGERGTN